MKLWRPLWVAAVTMFAGGCSLFPKGPASPTPVDAASAGLSTIPAPTVNDGWWKSFGDPQLDHIVETALSDNPTLAEAVARLAQAQSQAQAAGAGALPSVAVDSHEYRERFPKDDIVPPPFNGAIAWEGSTLLNFNWDLDFWGRQHDLIRQAGDQAQAAHLDVAAARLALAGAIAQAYVNFYRNQALASIANDSEEQRTHILSLTRKRVAAGLDTNVEVREAEGAVPRARVAREQAQAAAALAVHQLAALMGKGAGAYSDFQPPSLDPAAALPLPEALPADLLARRPDLLAAHLRLQAALEGQSAAEAAFYPDINLSAFAGQSAISLQSLLQAGSTTFALGPTLHLPIYRPQLNAELHGASAQVAERVAAYNAAVLAAVQQVADQLTQVQSLGQQISDQAESLQAAEQAYRLAIERYGAGLSNHLDVLNADSEVLEARRQRVELASSQLISRVTLLLAIGGSFHLAPAPQENALNAGATP